MLACSSVVSIMLLICTVQWLFQQRIAPGLLLRQVDNFIHFNFIDIVSVSTTDAMASWAVSTAEISDTGI